MAAPGRVHEFALRDAGAADLPAIQRLHAYSSATLARNMHDAAQIAGHTELTQSLAPGGIDLPVMFMEKAEATSVR